MKPILIDDLVINNKPTSEFKLLIGNNEVKGWQIAKPLNYENQFLSTWSKIKMAYFVLIGKAIAVQYFKDLTEKQQIEYVKSKLKIK